MVEIGAVGRDFSCHREPSSEKADAFPAISLDGVAILVPDKAPWAARKSRQAPVRGGGKAAPTDRHPRDDSVGGTGRNR